MNALEIEAGPELDKLIAEKAMGWDVAYVRQVYGHENNFRPSHSIAHAWEVVEHFRALSYDVELHTVSESRWQCQLINFDPDADPKRDEEHNGIADTAPLAICRAALMAVQ